MAGIKDYSTTQANNTDLNGINTAEGMLPSNLNNAIRALMKNTREWFNDSQWVEYGDGDAAFTAAYASATSFTIAGVNVTPIYHASRRIKLTATTPGTIYGTISSSSFSTNTTVNVTWDSGSLSSEAITNVYIGALSKTNSSIPTGIIGTTNIDDDAVTTAKIADGNITVAKMAVNSVDSDQYVDGSIDTAHIADSNITVAKMAANSVDSDQYVDGSIDTVHIGDDQITSAKIPDSAITSAKIADGAIVDADINASAAISLSKLENLTTARALVSDGSGDVSVSDVTSTEVGYLDGVSSAIQTQIDAKQASDADLTAIAALAKTDGNLIVGNGSTWVAESGATARTSLGLGTISTQASDNVSLTGGSITGLGEPSSNSDASTKSYVDQAVAGLRTRTIAECASTANVTISSALEAGDAIDGVTLVAGDRVLLKDQSTATENGLYIAVASGAGAASRDPEHDTIAELSGGMVVVNQGSVNDNKIFLCTTDSDGSLGSTSITYTVVTPSNSGTVTSIATGTGIDGGTITSTGTISIDSTVATLAGTQTLTNKTLTSPIVATPTISGSASSAGAIAFKEDTDNGTNSVTLKGAAATADVTVTLPAATDTLVGKATTDTLTNKTLTSPKINEDVAVTSTATELNLLDGVSGLVQADFTKLAAIDATADEIDTLDALSRGSIIYGNASAATTVLTKGTANQVLTSDGTDISWSDPASGGLDWQTIVTASTLTAVAGNAYWIDTTSNTCTITLPSSASNGDQIILADYARNWGTNKIIIDSNGLNYQGEDDTYTVEYITSGETVNIVYSGATNGWIPLDDDAVADAPVPPATEKAIFGFGLTGSNVSMSNLVSSSGVVASDVTGVGTARQFLAAAGYGGDKAIFGFGATGSKVSMTNLVSSSGVVSSDTTGVGTARNGVAAATYGGNVAGTAIFAFGDTGSATNVSNLVNSSGVVASDTTGVGTARSQLAAAGYGLDKAIFGYGYDGSSRVSMTNLVSSSGVVAADVTGVGQIRNALAAAGYGGDKAIFGYGILSSPFSITNLVSNTGVVSSDTAGVGTARSILAAASYGRDKAIFGFGYDGSNISISSLVSNSGVVASDTTGVGTARRALAAAGYSYSA